MSAAVLTLFLLATFLGGVTSGVAGFAMGLVMTGICLHILTPMQTASLIAGYGFTGILVSFMARHHPLGILPVAVLFGGLSAGGGLLQRQLHLSRAPLDSLGRRRLPSGLP